MDRNTDTRLAPKRARYGLATVLGLALPGFLLLSSVRTAAAGETRQGDLTPDLTAAAAQPVEAPPTEDDAATAAPTAAPSRRADATAQRAASTPLTTRATARTPAPVPDPSGLIQLSAVMTGGVRLDSLDLPGAGMEEEATAPMFGVAGEVRLISFAGLRGAVVMESLGSGSHAARARGGFAVHFASSTIRPDIYLLNDYAIDINDSGEGAGLREVSVGLGFRVRLGRNVLVGVEGALAHGGIPAGNDDPWNRTLERVKQGETIDPQVAIQVGTVL